MNVYVDLWNIKMSDDLMGSNLYVPRAQFCESVGCSLSIRANLKISNTVDTVGGDRPDIAKHIRRKRRLGRCAFPSELCWASIAPQSIELHVRPMFIILHAPLIPICFCQGEDEFTRRALYCRHNTVDGTAANEVYKS